jgi:hypothetical protein
LSALSSFPGAPQMCSPPSPCPRGWNLRVSSRSLLLSGPDWMANGSTVGKQTRDNHKMHSSGSCLHPTDLASPREEPVLISLPTPFNSPVLNSQRLQLEWVTCFQHGPDWYNTYPPAPQERILLVH